jgi:protein ImuB
MKNSTSGRLACVDLPAFPLQLLLKLHPDWVVQPAAVVAEDKPQGIVLWVNERARQAGVLPGMRYAAALSLAAGLRAGEIAPGEITQSVTELTRLLMDFSPEVEACADEPGVFWLNGAGLRSLYHSPRRWTQAILNAVKAQGFAAGIVVGFSRFGTYAMAKAQRGTLIFRDPTEERRASEKVSLGRLKIDPCFRDSLSKLGVKTVGDLLSLPPAGLGERFGAGAYRLHQMAAGELWAPLDPCKLEEPVAQARILDNPESDATRLLFLIKQMLHPMLAALAKRFQALSILWLSLLMDDRSTFKEQLRPATPTLLEAQLIDLVRLRLESLRLAAGVIEIGLQAEFTSATREQLRLFAEQPKRDFDAGNRALARLRAEFGDEAVVRAALKDGHLPEARFVWEPFDKLRPATPNSNAPRTLMRRITVKPIMLPGSPVRTHEDGWLLVGHRYGSVDHLTGPYIFSGGWWNREIHREYYYAQTRRGDILWLYYDRLRRKWFLQGAVE